MSCASASKCWAVGYYGNGVTLTLTYPALPPPAPTSVVSRKNHGAAGPFDIDLPLAGTPGIECRSGGAAGDYQVVATFSTAVTFVSADVAAGTATVASADGGGTPVVTINLTGVTNAQTLTLTLFNLSDGTSTTNIAISMSILTGDTTADTFVNSGDIAQTKSRSGQVVGSANFRSDVTADGNLNSADIGLVKSKSGTALP